MNTIKDLEKALEDLKEDVKYLETLLKWEEYFKLEQALIQLNYLSYNEEDEYYGS